MESSGTFNEVTREVHDPSAILGHIAIACPLSLSPLPPLSKNALPLTPKFWCILNVFEDIELSLNGVQLRAKLCGLRSSISLSDLKAEGRDRTRDKEKERRSARYSEATLEAQGLGSGAARSTTPR